MFNYLKLYDGLNAFHITGSHDDVAVDNCSGNENQLNEKYTDQFKATNSSQDLPAVSLGKV